MSMENYAVRDGRNDVLKEYIRKNHYSGSVVGSAECVGLYEERERWWDKNLDGAIAFAMPISENVRSQVFGEENKDWVIELHRMHTKDRVPDNTGSFFISKALDMIKSKRPEIRAVISFADPMEGHLGIQYQASNAWYSETSEKELFYKDQKGNIRHKRRNGENISEKEAKRRGWEKVKREAKHRYLWFLPDNHGKYNSKDKLIELCKLELNRDYPKPKRQVGQITN